MLIAQLTDTHIRTEGALAYGVVDTAAFLARAVRHIEALAPRPDIVLMTGDLTDFGTPEEYGRFLSLTQPIGARLLPIPGNHDVAGPFRDAFPHIAALCAEDDLSYVVEGYPLRLIMLDTSVAGRPHGEMTPARLDWLDRVLAQAPDQPALVAMHHPPFLTGIAHMDVQNCRNGGAFARLLARHQQVVSIVCGHVHRAVFTQFAGIPASIAPGPAHAVTLALDPAAPPSFSLEPPAIHLHAWSEDFNGGRLVTHLSPIGVYPGPFPFFDADGALLNGAPAARE